MNLAAADYGDAALLRIGPKRLFVFTHPASAKHVLADNAANYRKGIGLVQAKRAIGDGLLTSDGELWAKQRRMIQPSFQAKRIAAQAELVADEAQRLLSRLEASIGRGPVQLTELLTELALGVLGSTLLSTDLESVAGIGHSFEAVQDQAMFEMVTLGLLPTWLPLPKQLRFRRERRRLDEVIDQLVRSRRARGDLDAPDALARLIRSADAEAEPATGRQRIRDELVTLLLAGHETTASTLSWTFHLLDEHRQVQHRVRAELDAALGDRPPAYEDLHRLPYTTAVIEEVMRLYPPVWLLPRLAREPDEIAGIRIPAGADVLISPYLMHRHPAFWTDPERFRPDRFTAENTDQRPRYAYLPFGAGPRFCIGSNLAMIETVFVLATVLRRVTLRKVPGRPVRPEPMLSLRIRGGLPMTVHPA